MHLDLKSELSVPIHFGTFVTGDEVRAIRRQISAGQSVGRVLLADTTLVPAQMLWSVEMLSEACERADVPLRRCREDWAVSRDEARSSSAFALLDIGRGVSIVSSSSSP